MYTMSMDFAEVFSRLGLGMHSAEVYAVLLASKEPMLVAHLAASVGISRTQAYRNIEELLEMGFIRKVPLGKRHGYYAEHPERIEKKFASALRKTEAVTERYAKARERDVPRHVRFFSGAQGIRDVFDDVMDHTPRGATFYRYTSERDLAAVNRYLSPSYRARRDKKKLERLVISNPVSGKQKRARLERFIKYIEPEAALFDQNVIQLIYGKRLAFINLSTEEAFIIEDEALASFQRVIFGQLYRKL